MKAPWKFWLTWGYCPGVLGSLGWSSIFGTDTSWRFGANFCRPSAHCSHLSLTDSGTLEAKFSPAARTSKLAPKRLKWNTVQQSKNRIGLTMWVWWSLMKDEKLHTQFGSIRSSFLATPIFNILTLGGSLDWTGWGIFMRYVSEFQKFNNLSKTVSLVEIFYRVPKKIII